MFVADKLRRSNIAEYLLYMWQVEDTIRAFGCSLSRLRREYIAPMGLNEEQADEEADWFGNLIRMINDEGLREKGHLQINKATMQMLIDLHEQLIESPKYPYYRAEYYRVLPFIVELRGRGANKEEHEVETCFGALYGLMMLRLRKQAVGPATQNALKEISTLIGMLSDYYNKNRDGALEF